MANDSGINSRKKAKNSQEMQFFWNRNWHSPRWVAVHPAIERPFIAGRKKCHLFPLLRFTHHHWMSMLRRGGCTGRSCSRCRCRPRGCTPGCGSPWSGHRRGSGLPAITFLTILVVFVLKNLLFILTSHQKSPIGGISQETLQGHRTGCHTGNGEKVSNS